MPALHQSSPFLLFLPLALLALAGCASPPEGEVAEALPAEPPIEATAPAYACPPRGTPSEGGMCLAALDTRADAPTIIGLAAAPGRPATWALLAYTWPAAPDATEPQRQLARPGADYTRSFLYVTEDEGQAWEKRMLPVMDIGHSATSAAARLSTTIATTMAWDDAGRLHVAGYAEAQVEEGLCECPPTVTSEFWVFHAVTADLGRTWEARELGLWDETLRPRLGHRPGLLALAYGTPVGDEVFVSRDDGATWTPADGHPQCEGGDAFLTDGRMVASGDDLLFRCRGQAVSFFHRLVPDGPEGPVLLLEDGPAEADPDGEEFVDCTAVFLRLWRGRPVLVGGECPDVRMWVLGAGGDWNGTMLLDGGPSPGFSQAATGLRGAEVVGDVLHLFMDRSEHTAELTGTKRELVHAAFAMDGTLLSLAALPFPDVFDPGVAGRLLDSFAADPFATAGDRTVLLFPKDGTSYTYIG